MKKFELSGASRGGTSKSLRAKILILTMLLLATSACKRPYPEAVATEVAPDPTRELPPDVELETTQQLFQRHVNVYTDYYAAESLEVHPIEALGDETPEQIILTDRDRNPTIAASDGQIFIDTEWIEGNMDETEQELISYFTAAFGSIETAPFVVEEGNPVLYNGYAVRESSMRAKDHEGLALTYSAVHLSVLKIAQDRNLMEEYMVIMEKLHNRKIYRNILLMHVFLTEGAYLISRNAPYINDPEEVIFHYTKNLHQSDIEGFIELFTQSELTANDFITFKMLLNAYLQGQISSRDVIDNLVRRHNLLEPHLPLPTPIPTRIDLNEVQV